MDWCPHQVEREDCDICCNTCNKFEEKTVAKIGNYDEQWAPPPAVEGAGTDKHVQTQHMPSDDAERKRIPIAAGFIDYFPDAIIEVAKLSQIGNDQHNPGQPLHWSKDKSTDHDGAIMHHFMDRGTRDKDGVRHRAKVAWRAMAALQIEIETERTGGVPK